MPTQTIALNQQIDIPINGPKRVKKQRWRSHTHSSDFNISHYSTVLTQFLSKSSSISASSSSRYFIKELSDPLVPKFPLALSRLSINPMHMTRRVLRSRSRTSRGVKIRKVLHVKCKKFNITNKWFSSEASRQRDITTKICLSNASLSQKYQPRVFADVAGHKITIKAVSNAIEETKIASLYLFHGPCGTGKTTVARIFGMALNCESTSFTKPCWNCRGCSRSLFIMDLCSGNRTDGLDRIKTQLEDTSFAKAINRFKVIIIKQSHLFTAGAWEELLGLAERANDYGVVFVIVTVDATVVPQNISSRCQKFFFPKLTVKEITRKLTKVAACERIRIEVEALRLIAAKAEGSLREAENLLDQLSLLGSTVTISTVQQLVGLVPENKLLGLLVTTISGDAIKTMKYTRELLTTGVQPLALVSQLASLVADTLSDTAVSASSPSTGLSEYSRLLIRVHQIANSQPGRFCHVLKALVEIERKLRCSTDQNTVLMTTLLEITSNDVSNRVATTIVLPNKENFGNIGTEFCNIPPAEGVISEVDSSSRADMIRPINSEDLHSESLVLSGSHSCSHSISSNSEQSGMGTNEMLIGTNGNTKNQGYGIPEDEKAILPNMSDMEEIWRKTLRGIQNGYAKELLLQAKLASLTVSSANIIVHLMFKRSEDKIAAQMSEGSICRVLQNTTGCNVILNVSLEPVEMEIMKDRAVWAKNQSYNHAEPQPRAPHLTDIVMQQSIPQESSSPLESSRLTKFKHKTKSQGQHRYTPELTEENTEWPRNISPVVELPTNDPETKNLTRGKTSRGTAHIKTTNEPKQRCLSVSSIAQSDASVEPYSRDIFFDEADNERRGNRRENRMFRKGFLKYVEHHGLPNNRVNQRWSYNWGCRDVLCSRQTR